MRLRRVTASANLAYNVGGKSDDVPELAGVGGEDGHEGEGEQADEDDHLGGDDGTELLIGCATHIVGLGRDIRGHGVHGSGIHDALLSVWGFESLAPVDTLGRAPPPPEIDSAPPNVSVKDHLVPQGDK